MRPAIRAVLCLDTSDAALPQVLLFTDDEPIHASHHSISLPNPGAAWNWGTSSQGTDNLAWLVLECFLGACTANTLHHLFAEEVIRGIRGHHALITREEVLHWLDKVLPLTRLHYRGHNGLNPEVN